MRLDRLLVTLSLGSRSQVQKSIRQGNVTVDGNVVLQPEKQVNPGSEVAVSGEKIDTRLERHIVMNKPAGLLTAARDKKQKTVMDLLPAELVTLGCMPVGRLDKDTTGVLIFTTDGEMNHRLLAPGRHVDKTYYATVEGFLGQENVEIFARGIHLPDFDAAPGELEIVAADAMESTARLTIHEGKFHQVKRMFEAVGHNVKTLHRESFGPIDLTDGLPEGAWREMTEDEMTKLRRAAQM